MIATPTNKPNDRAFLPRTEKRLFTPGPLTTSRTVKQAMLRDLGSRDAEFVEIVQGIRQRLLGLAGVSQEAGYEAILMQGSGTSGVEALISSVIPRGGKLLVIVNGAYGKRIRDIAQRHGIETETIEVAENLPVEPQQVCDSLAADSGITHVALVHCETSSGVLHPVREIGAMVKKFQRMFIVDAMSSFGGIPLDVAEFGIDFLAASANKCLEGVPGISFVIANRGHLLASDGAARSVSLDLLAQWEGLEKDGQFRFTPPTHVILALHQALIELGEEGGVAGRAERYAANHTALLRGMRRMGFLEYVPAESQSHIITTFLFPQHPKFRFEEFYQRLSARGMVIYPGKLNEVDCFRIGNIGRLFESDIESLLAAIEATLPEMGVEISTRPPTTRPHQNMITIEYENYDSTSVSYDETRTPIGLPIILEHLASNPVTLGDQTVLDAGCGTGNYLAGLQGRIGTLHGMEFNTGMAQVARDRFADDPKVNIQQGSITALSGADGVYHGVICNQVLHHLDDGDDAEFPNVAEFFREAFRVLRPGGVLIINSSGHEQHRDGFWWAALVPRAIDRMLRRMPTLERLESNFLKSGFVDYAAIIPFDEVLQGEQYLDPKGPLSPAWRAGDSCWSLTTEAELAHALDEVGSRLDDGSMAPFISGREKLRAELGQTTFLIARKP